MKLLDQVLLTMALVGVIVSTFALIQDTTGGAFLLHVGLLGLNLFCAVQVVSRYVFQGTVLHLRMPPSDIHVQLPPSETP